MSTAPRQLPLEGCFNFRDLGGYPTADGRKIRRGRVYRSDSLHHLTARDAEHLRAEVDLGHLIDLRSSPEVEADGWGPLAQEAVAYHHVPLIEGDLPKRSSETAAMPLGVKYFLAASFAAGPIARALEILANAERPAVYFCAAGKDRTGVLSAVVLGLMGVEDAAIVEDYAATQHRIGDIMARLESAESYRRMLEVLPADTMHAEPETMKTFLRMMRETHGDLDGWAESVGLDRGPIERLRERLVE